MLITDGSVEARHGRRTHSLGIPTLPVTHALREGYGEGGNAHRQSAACAGPFANSDANSAPINRMIAAKYTQSMNSINPPSTP